MAGGRAKGRLSPGRTMKRLTAPELQAAHLAGDHGAFDRWLRERGNAPARLEFPLGELLNRKILGYVWPW